MGEGMELDAVLAELDRAVGCADERGIEELPDWVQPDGLGLAQAAAVDALRDALGTGPHRRRALALLWLATARDLSDVPTIERLVYDDHAAGAFPRVDLTQHSDGERAVDWVPMTLGEVALAGLERITGASFDDASAWSAWREEVSRFDDSPAVWHGRLRAGERPAVLVRLDPVLALRVRLLDAPGYHGWSEARIREAWRLHVGSDRTGRLLRREERWEEHEEPGAFEAFVAWALPAADTEDAAAALVAMAPARGVVWALEQAAGLPQGRDGVRALLEAGLVSPEDVEAVVALAEAARAVGFRSALPAAGELRADEQARDTVVTRLGGEL
jgi:hypothetical protein